MDLAFEKLKLKTMIIYENSTARSSSSSRREKPVFIVSSDATGEVILNRRKIAKALRWWLRENGFSYTSSFFVN